LSEQRFTSPEEEPSSSGSILAAQKGRLMQGPDTETFTNQEGARHALLQRSRCATNEGEKMKGANAHVTEWGFSDCGKTDAMSLNGSSGSSGCMEQEESRHQYHQQWLERLVLYKLCVMINCIDSLLDIKMIILILLRCRTGRETIAGMGLRSLLRR
jgi:hypothetical protein